MPSKSKGKNPSKQNDDKRHTLTWLPPPPWSDGVYLEEDESTASATTWSSSSSLSSQPTNHQQTQQKKPFSLPDFSFSLACSDATKKFVSKVSAILSQYYSKFPDKIPGLTAEEQKKTAFDGLMLKKMFDGYRLICKKRKVTGKKGSKDSDEYLDGHPSGAKYR
ncbi:hypothetical protein HDU76_008287, partial [Blyttiomyces sp. JEL0837]